MELCRWSSIAFFAAGGLFLLLRFQGISSSRSFITAAAACFAAAFALSLFKALRTLPDEKSLTVFLSSLVPGGGVVLSSAECAAVPGPFPPLPPLPKIKLRNGARLWGTFFAGAAFAAGALLLPLETPRQPAAPAVLDLKDETEQLSNALTALRRSSPEGEKKALPLQKELEETIQKADPGAPGRSYELLYELNKRLRNELAAESERTARLLKQTAAVQSALSALDLSGKGQRHAQSFSKVLKELAQKDPGLAEALKKGGFNGTALTPDQLKKLADSLGEESERLKKSLQDMSRHLENPSQCSEAELQEAREELANFIKENVPGCDDLIESLTNRDNNGEPGPQGGGGQYADGSGSSEGSGGAGRGRGDAFLEFSGYTPEYGAKRVDKKITPHLPGNKKESTVLGRFAADTEQKEEKYTVKAGTLQTGGGEAGFQESTLHPAHRRAVRRYFEKGKKKP